MRSIWAVLLLSFSMFTYADVEISAFEQLKTLLGKWKKEGSNGEQFYISFESTAGGTVLIENWVYKGASHSLTVYHQAGDQLLATHYCPQGNQPRLSSSGLDADGTIAFSFLDVTNLAGPEASHQYALSFKILSEKSLLRKESYKKIRCHYTLIIDSREDLDVGYLGVWAMPDHLSCALGPMLRVVM